VTSVLDVQAHPSLTRRYRARALLFPTLHPPTPTLFPYTTLFRSILGVLLVHVVALLVGDHLERQLVVVAQEEPPLRAPGDRGGRSEEHTSELQSRGDLVCRLRLDKKDNNGGTREARSARSNATRY